MTGIETDRRDALVERLFESTLGTLELFSVHLGWRLGLYRALRDADSLTPPELAAAAGIDERYAREWLEQQAVAGFLEVDDADAAADARRFRLPAEHADVLTDPASPVHVAPFAPMVVGVARRAAAACSTRTAAATASRTSTTAPTSATARA